MLQDWVKAEDIIKLTPKPFSVENHVIAVDGKKRPLISRRSMAKPKGGGVRR
jgi:hypothetical protein